MTQEERRERAAASKAARAEAWQQERTDKKLAADAMRSILQHPDSSPEQLIFAIEVLDSLEHYSLVPYNSFTRAQTNEAAEERRRTFAKEFLSKHPEIAKEIEDAKKHA